MYSQLQLRLLVTQFQDIASGVRRDISGDDQAKVKGYLKQMTLQVFSVPCIIPRLVGGHGRIVTVSSE